MRTLPAALQTVMDSGVRQPRFSVVAWDILSSGAPSLTTIIAGSASSAFQLDITQYVQATTVEEPGDKRAAHTTLILSDYLGTFDPVSGSQASYMQQNQVVQIKLGDATVPVSQYVGIAFMHIRGQVGFTFDRQSMKQETSISLYGRRGQPRYLKHRFTSPSYGNAVDFGQILQDVARTEMSMGNAELTRFPTIVGKLTQFTTNSIVDLSPIEAVDKILEAVGQASDFDGDGKLRTYSRDLRRIPDKVYPNLHLVQKLDIPLQDTETYNSVKIIGLDKNITEIKQPEQALATATIPVGFWRPNHSVEVFWSTDRSMRARNTVLQVKTSVNAALIVGLGTETYVQLSEFGGRIDVGITSFLIGLVAIITVTYIAATFVPDGVVAVGTGHTIPIGRLLEGVALQIILLALTTQSSGVYEVRGTPILPVFKEISAVLTVEGTPDFLLNQREIKNDWVNTQEHLLEIAIIELLFEAAQAKPRRITVLDDYTIEIGDIIQIPFGGTPLRLWVASLRRTVGRETIPMLEIDGYFVPTAAF